MRRSDLLNENVALLLDFDGTLVDLAPDPMGIAVDPGLRETLDKIAAHTYTPVAIVTGRQIDRLDGFLALPHIPVSGNHGTESRLPGQSDITRHVPPLREGLKLALKSFCAEFGCTLEDKNETAVVIAPNDAAFHIVRNELQKLIAESFPDYSLWPIGLSLEIHHRSYNKITGMREMLATKAFKDYTPVYIGDDVETYPGLDVLAADGVEMFHVGPNSKEGFRGPQDVRDFLREFAQQKTEEDSFARVLAHAALVRF